MVAQFIEALREQRGRYPVANLAGDYLANGPAQPYRLGDWLGLVGLSELEDIQCKLEQFLGGAGPEHAAEDLIACVHLVSMAEAGAAGKPRLGENEVVARLQVWHEANMLEKLRRRELVSFSEGLSIDPAVRPVTRFHATVAPELVNRFLA
jgi:hypothetical protein